MRPLWKILFILIPLFVIIGAIVAALSRGRLYRRLVPLVEAQLSQSLKREVRLRSISGNLVTTAVVHDLRIAEGQRLSQGELARAHRVVVHYRLSDIILHPARAAEAVSRVNVAGLRLKLTRNPAGAWNIAPLLKPKPPRFGRFAGVVSISDSTVLYTDHTPPRILRRPLRLTLINLSGDARPHPQRGGVLRFAGKLAAARPEPVTIAFSFVGTQVNLNVTIERAALAEWDRRLSLRGPRLRGGVADVNFTGFFETGPHRQPLQYVALASVRNGAATVPQSPDPFRALNGSFLIANDQVRILAAKGVLGDLPFDACGVVTGFKQPQLDMRVTASGPLAGALSRLTKLRLPPDMRAGPGQIALAVRGSLAHPAADGSASVAAARIRDLAVANLTTQLSYRAGMVWLNGLRANVAGGEVNGDVWLGRRGAKAEAAFQARAEGFDLGPALAALHIKSPWPITGKGHVFLAGSYDAQGLRAAGSFEARDGRVADIAYTGAYGVAQFDRGDIRIASGRMESPAGTAVIEGTIASRGAVALQVRASGIDLAALSRAAGAKEQQITGAGYFAGEVTGTLRDPVAAGTFQATDLEFEQQRFAIVSGSVMASRDRAAVRDLLAYQENARYEVSGAMEGLRGPRADGRISATVVIGFARLADVLAMAKIEANDVRGELAANLTVGGTLDAPTASGHVVVHRPEWKGWALDRAETDFALAGETVRLSGAQATIGRSTVTALGEVSRQGAIQVKFDADVALDDLRPPPDVKPRLDVTGRLVARGEITGTTEQPQINAQARSDLITVQGQAFTGVTAKATYAPATQRNDFEVAFAQGDARFTASGWADAAARTMQVRGDLAQGQIAALRSALEAIGSVFPQDSLPWKAAQVAAAAPSPAVGQLDARISLGGPWRNLTGDIGLKTSATAVAGVALPDAAAALALSGRIITVRSFEARQEPAFATARGTIDLDGPLALELDAYNIQAGVFKPWLHLRQEVKGSADVSISLGGTLRQPQIVGSIVVADLTIGPVKVDQAQAPRFEVHGDSLVAPEIDAVLGPHVIQASAAIPITWKPVGINRAGSWSVAVDLTNQDLSLLTRLAPNVQAASGTLDGRVTFTGSLEQPQLLGAVTIARGALALRGQRTRVNGLEGTVQFDGSRIALQRLTGVVGGGSFQAQGDIGLVTLSPSHLMSNRFNLTLVGRGLGIDAAPAFNGKVDINLALATTKPGDVALRGQVVLAAGQVGVPQRPEVSPIVEQPRFNPGLDIAVTFAPSLRVRTATIAMDVSGSGHVGGRLGSPSASALVESRRGTLAFPAATFRISYASMDATISPPRVPAPDMPAVAQVRAFIRVEAEARVRGYDVRLTMSGPLTDPNVEPRIELTSVPALDSERLWAMVSGLPVGPEASAFGSRSRALLTTGVSVIALSPLERATARILGVEEFGIEYFGYEPLSLRVGTYLFKKFYVTYRRSITSSVRAPTIPGWEFTLANQVLPTLSLGVALNERNEIIWKAQTALRF
jgi:hypothetical protein